MSGNALYDYLERLTSLMRAWSREHPLLAELQPVQVSALHYLSRCNGYSNTPMAVTEYLGLTKGTVSQSLKVLEHKGLIRKQPDPQDKRSVRLELTGEGTALLEALTPPAFLQQAAEALGLRGEMLEALLRELLVTIQRQQDVPSFGLCGSCRFHERREEGPFCGLTRQPLASGAERLIRREHESA